jgi:hypothetical protein
VLNPPACDLTCCMERNVKQPKRSDRTRNTEILFRKGELTYKPTISRTSKQAYKSGSGNFHKGARQKVVSDGMSQAIYTSRFQVWWSASKPTRASQPTFLLQRVSIPKGCESDQMVKFPYISSTANPEK